MGLRDCNKKLLFHGQWIAIFKVYLVTFLKSLVYILFKYGVDPVVEREDWMFEVH